MAETKHPHHYDSAHPPPVTSVLPDGDVPDGLTDLSDDEAALVALGYKQEFKREFSLWTTFCVSFAVMGLLPSIASTQWYGLGYAGGAGLTWGWLLSSFFILCVAASMAELCSSMPTSGGLYYASAVLAPKGWGPLAAWITGWSNWLVQVTAAPSVNYAGAAMTLAAASIMNPDYVPTDWQVFLLTIFIMLLHGCISSMPTLWVARFNSVGTTVNLIGLFAVIITIPVMTKTSPKFNPTSVAWSVQNFTEWPDGIAVLMSFIAIIWTMSGYDASFHLSEECSNANVASPRSIVLTAGSGAIFGFILNTLIAYTVVDISEVIESELGQPFAAYLIQILPRDAALACLAITIITSFMMGQSCMVAASRVAFAYARDDCFPGSSWIRKVNKYTYTPVNAVWFNTVIGCLLLLLIFGGPVCISAIFSVGALAAYIAFSIPIFIKTFFVGKRFRRGPWHLGRFSTISGVLSTCFTLVMMPIMCFPSVRGASLSAELMNWTCLVYGGPMTFVIIWWFVRAHKWFKGPKINVEHHMLHPGLFGLNGADVERANASDELPESKEEKI